MSEVRDPLHNFILYDDFEKRIIDSRPLQRLKHVKQLALTCEVYPGATHSRFEHSLGTMELAGQAFDRIANRDDSPMFMGLGWKPGDRENYRHIVRIGALVHDVGHAPFSHGPEELLPAGFSGHEQFSEAIIRSRHIAPLLNMGPVTLNLDHVVAVALGPEKCPQEDPSLQLLQELVAGELGVDRMDYLARDALHTGSTAGRFDYHRLLNTLTVIEHPETGSPVLAIEAGGLHAAEGLLMARYFMFVQVYFHHVRRIYDVHLKDFLAAILPGGRFPEDVDEYLNHSDPEIESEIAREAEGGKHQELAGRLVNRQHYRTACQVTGQQRANDPEIFERLQESVEKEFGDAVRVDQAGKDAQTLEPGKVYIQGDDGKPRDILFESELIFALKPIWRGRVYAKAEKVPEVIRFCASLMEEGGKE